jgi:hypothetical protein
MVEELGVISAIAPRHEMRRAAEDRQLHHH